MVADRTRAEAFLDIAPDPLGHDEGSGPFCFGEDESELFAAIAAREIDLTHVFANDLRAGTKRLVTDSVTVTIVYLLEVIEVQQDQRKAQTVPVGTLDLAPHAGVEEVAVVEAGEAIGDRILFGGEKRIDLDELRVMELVVKVVEVVEGGDLKANVPG